MNNKFIVGIICGCVFLLGFIVGTTYKILNELIEERIATYELIQGINTTSRINTNMSLRCYHYIRGHNPGTDGATLNCPECYELLQNGGENRNNHTHELEGVSK